ncbi:MAG: hypothetical protein HRF49_04235 [bacterium]
MKGVFANWGLKLWALVLAMALSAFVNSLDYKITETIKSPLVMNGLNANLVLSGQLPSTVSFQVRGPLSVVRKLRTNTPASTINLENYVAPGNYEAEVNIPLAPGVDVVKGPGTIGISLKEKKTRVLKIEVSRVGRLHPDFIESELTIQPEEVRVSGAPEEVDRVAHAMVEVQLTQRNKNETRIADIELFDDKYQPLPRSLFSMDRTVARYELKVSSLSNVRILKLFPEIKGEPAPGFAFDVEIEPRYLTVPLELVEGHDVSVVYTEPIDLAGVKTGFKKDVKINYGFSNTEGLLQTAKVTVNVIDTTTRASSSLNRTIEVVGGEKGTNVLVKPGYVVISASEIALLTDAERATIKALLDISGLPPGEYRIVPQIVLDPKIKNASIFPSEVDVEIALGGES